MRIYDRLNLLGLFGKKDISKYISKLLVTKGDHGKSVVAYGGSYKIKSGPGCLQLRQFSPPPSPWLSASLHPVQPINFEALNWCFLSKPNQTRTAHNAQAKLLHS